MFSHSVKIAYFCLVSVLVATAQENSDDDGGRIVGGQVTTIDKVPYLVQLRTRFGGFFCGGTTISGIHVLTAAHCIDTKLASNIFVVAGASTINDAGEKHSVNKTIIHPLYFSGIDYNFDIAMLVLNDPMSGSIFETAKLPTLSPSVGQLIQVFGWGFTSEKDHAPSVDLRTVTLPIISLAECILQNGINAISESMFCAAAPGKDACTGDSGGPAIAGNKLVGIVSWGIGCASEESPGVYTDVATALPFINECLKS